MKFLPIHMLDNIIDWTEKEDEQWLAAVIKYEKYLDSIKNALPEEFYKFCRETSFHDFDLISYRFIHQAEQVNLETVWKKGEEAYLLCFHHLYEHEIKINTRHKDCLATYLYGEVTRPKRNKIAFECIFEIDEMMKVVCEKISFSKMDNSSTLK